MFKGSKTIFVACSGGPDSTALFHILFSYFHRDPKKIGIIHVNHHLRGKKSLRDQKFVEKLGKTFGVPVIIGNVNVEKFAREKKRSIEEAARDLRYDFFIQTTKTYLIDTIVLAHTLNDQAETVLMRLLTGTGLQGLAGSRPVFLRNKIRFVRPFIETEKKDILNYLREKKIKFCTDETNQETRFLRNKIRLELLPFLEKKFNSGIQKVLARIPESVGIDAEFLEREAERQFKNVIASPKGVRQSRDYVVDLRSPRNDESASVIFDRKKFDSLETSIQFRLLQMAVRKLSELEFSFNHWISFQELLEKKKNFKISFPGNLMCVATPKHVTVGFLKSSRQNSFSYHLEKGKTLFLPENKISIEAQPVKFKQTPVKKKSETYAVIDMDKIRFPLIVRNREKGDRFRPLGQTKSSKLKDFLIRKKIPRETRDRLPLVLSGNELIWVAGVGISENVKVEEKTAQFLRLQMKKTNKQPLSS